MKIFPNKSRFSYGLLMLLLVVSVAGSFFTLHNHAISESSKGIPYLAIVFAVLAIVISIFFYQSILSAWAEAARSSSQLDQLKASLRETRRKEEVIKKEEEEAQEQTHEENLEEIANGIIPVGSFEEEEEFLEKLLSNIAKQHDIVQAVAYTREKNNTFTITSSYAFFSETEPQPFAEGLTLPGQVAKNKVILNLDNVPENYITILSGLGKGSPSNLLIIPILNPDKTECIGVIELASFKAFNSRMVALFETLSPKISEQLISIGNSKNSKYDNP